MSMRRGAGWLMAACLSAAGSPNAGWAEGSGPPALIEVGPAPVAEAVSPVRPAGPASAPSPAAPQVLGQAPPTGAVEPASPPAPIAAVSPDTLPGAIELRLAEGGNLWPPRLPKRDREALSAFYRTGAFAPLWISAGAWNPAATAVGAALARAGEEGLDAADYPMPVIAPAGKAASPADLAEAEIKLSALAALYARDARGGRIDPARLSSLITPKLDLPAADAVLALIRAAPDPVAALQAYNPRHPGYLALKAKLAEVRAARPGLEPSVMAPGRREFTARSIAVLGDVPSARPAAAGGAHLEGEIVANMERWRWLPAEIVARYVAVNIPEFRLRLVEGGRVVHEARVVTGKPESPTPVFSGLMEYAIVNPSWFIPPSIMKKEILPGLAADPLYAARRGYEVIRHGSQISVRQPPGERNALGFIKFMFPNQHAVYLHDTPSRNLFGLSRRAFSHGCVRVDDPFRLADFVLGHAWSESRLKKLIGRGERTIFLPQKLPVHLTYFTLAVDEFGELRSFEDLYGYSRRVRAALGLGA